MEQTIAEILKQGGYYAILVGILYYFLAIYIPKKDEAYERRIDSMQQTFTNAMQSLADKLDNRLREIEEIIKVRK